MCEEEGAEARKKVPRQGEGSRTVEDPGLDVLREAVPGAAGDDEDVREVWQSLEQPRRSSTGAVRPPVSAQRRKQSRNKEKKKNSKRGKNKPRRAQPTRVFVSETSRPPLQWQERGRAQKERGTVVLDGGEDGSEVVARHLPVELRQHRPHPVPSVAGVRAGVNGEEEGGRSAGPTKRKQGQGPYLSRLKVGRRGRAGLHGLAVTRVLDPRHLVRLQRCTQARLSVSASPLVCRVEPISLCLPGSLSVLALPRPACCPQTHVPLGSGGAA